MPPSQKPPIRPCHGSAQSSLQLHTLFVKTERLKSKCLVFQLIGRPFSVQCLTATTAGLHVPSIPCSSNQRQVI